MIELIPGKWIRAVLLPNLSNAKTQKYRVLSSKQIDLGVIKWCGSFRSYAFCPNASRIFEPECLETICGWINVLNEEHKKRTKP